MTQKHLGRRSFITKATVGTLGVASVLAACSSEKVKISEDVIPELLDQAPDGKVIKAGLVGCGGRGTGAALNFLDAGPNLQIVALGDVFQDKIDNCREQLKKERGVEVADENCFIGFDAYEKVIDAGVDLVLLCTPPHFRPVHVEAAINARKNVFMEKPCAVDPVGARSVLASSKKAEALGLSMVSGTIRRVQKDYMTTALKVKNGEIGEIVGANIIRNGGALWHRKRNPEWTDMEYMLRNWVNHCWLSGDHITEQFIHELDVMSWFLGENPKKAIGYGGRQRRLTGDLYDFFSIEYEYENGMRAHCAARQINGCANGKVERIVGTKGVAIASGKILDTQGNEVWNYPKWEEGVTDPKWKVTNPFVQEHINLVTAIRTGKPVNDAEAQVNSTLTSIMGRIAAYTGKEVTWEEVMNSDLYLGPKTYAFGPLEEINNPVPLAGEANKLS
ncbi:Gfo/Idh/MocA family oxidoreductase [Maribellus sp. YY47]|uniref:Gfo/Idh/MocA family protein n=1 Tax=Maribellus sp. YY47 TaxID=2929486 RepID=UPI002000E4D8|nr:Gfo/Idh/MocA family oxidoreductase [Maribellus sp. YY47]MCK3686025.1 Gfo/Idh/MocA family oxidoreductase [Maribellus sp. YY47]